MKLIETEFVLPNYLLEKLSYFSKEMKMKKSSIVADALIQYFHILENQLILRRVEDIKTKKVEPIEFDEIKKELNL